MWSMLDRTTGRLKLGNCEFTVDAARPDFGVTQVSIGSHTIAGLGLLTVASASQQASHAWRLHETFTRQSDLVASFSPWAGDTVQPHIYWRARENRQHSAVGMDLIVSVQTSLLDSSPALEVGGIFPTSQVKQPASASGLFISPLVDQPFAIVSWIHPADYQGAKFYPLPSGGLQWTAELFSERLEKGVIRRARFGFWLLPIINAERAALELHQEISAEAPPLTA